MPTDGWIWIFLGDQSHSADSAVHVLFICANTLRTPRSGEVRWRPDLSGAFPFRSLPFPHTCFSRKINRQRTWPGQVRRVRNVFCKRRLAGVAAIRPDESSQELLSRGSGGAGGVALPRYGNHSSLITAFILTCFKISVFVDT